jgi:hypothetical protein
MKPRKLYWVQDAAEDEGYQTSLEGGVLTVNFPSAKAAARFCSDMMVRYGVAVDIRGYKATITESTAE